MTVSWRVGADGFLHLGDGTANLGLLDQVAALERVRDNIVASAVIPPTSPFSVSRLVR